MIGAIAGDIIGSRFEGNLRPPQNFDLFDDRLCRFTDDTVCTIAIAEALMSRTDFASTLRAFVRNHPNRGYGANFRKWALSEDAPAYGSWANGAPMRTSAVGWLAGDEAELLKLAGDQASVSHDHPDAIAASQAVASAIFYLRHGMPPPDVRERTASSFGYDLSAERAFRPGTFDITAKGTAQSAIVAALDASDWETAVRAAIGLGGDTDTLACIAGAIAEAAHGVPRSIADAAKAYLSPDLLAVLNRFRTKVSQGRVATDRDAEGEPGVGDGG